MNKKESLIISVIMILLLIILAGCSDGVTVPSEEDVEAVRSGIDIGTIISDTFSGHDDISVSYSLDDTGVKAAGSAMDLVATAVFSGYSLSADLTIGSGTMVFYFQGSVSGSSFTAERFTVKTAEPLAVMVTGGTGAVDVTISIPDDANAMVNASAVIGADGKPSEVSIADAYLPASSSASVSFNGADPEAVPSFGEPGTGNAGTGSGGPSATPGDDKVSAPIPVFLTGISEEISAVMSLADDGGLESIPEDECYVMYKITVGAPAFIGFGGETEETVISDVQILDSTVSLEWEETDGIFTYRTSDDSSDDIVVELRYDSTTDSYDYLQAVRCEYEKYMFDYYVVSVAEDVRYDEATSSWNGDYMAYITMRKIASDSPYFFNNIASGKFHSEDDLTGVFVYHMDHKSPASGDIDDGVDRDFDLDAALAEHDGIEAARLLIDKMNVVSTTMEQNAYQLLYSQNSSYKIFKYSNDSTTEAREACLKHIEEISEGNWKIDPSSIPEPSAS